jgi:hypothetical protein
MRVGGRARLSVTTKTTQVFRMSISLILDVGHSVSNRFFCFYQSSLFFQRCISFGVSGAFNAKPLYLNGFFVNRLPPILHAQVEMVASIPNQFIWLATVYGRYFFVVFGYLSIRWMADYLDWVWHYLNCNTSSIVCRRSFGTRVALIFTHPGIICWAIVTTLVWMNWGRTWPTGERMREIGESAGHHSTAHVYIPAVDIPLHVTVWWIHKRVNQITGRILTRFHVIAFAAPLASI